MEKSSTIPIFIRLLRATILFVGFYWNGTGGKSTRHSF